ncbi:MAG: hypothetical protein AAB482_02360 [Patescibacteria group bacterium]
MKNQTNYLLIFFETLCIGVFVFSVLTYAQGFYTESQNFMPIIQRPIGDSLVYKLLLLNSSNTLSDIESDLRSTELRGLDDDLLNVEDIFREQ